MPPEAGNKGTSERGNKASVEEPAFPLPAGMRQHARQRPDFSHRADLAEFPEWMDEPCSREQMRACLRDLARVNRWFLGYRPVLDWLGSLELQRLGRPVRVLDVGCGYGDTLREVELWARRRGVPVELTGLDLSADAIAIAAEASGAASRVRWVAGDMFGYRTEDSVDLVISSLFTHHLRDGDVVRFLRWMEVHASIGWLINDLSRAPVPYHLFSWFARATRLHPFVQHDGPVSFARAFRPEDWRGLCAKAGLRENDFKLQAYKPARLCVSRSKER